MTTLDFAEAHELLDEEPYDEEMEPGRAWRAPDGTPIVSTLEQNNGTAGVLTYCDEGTMFDYDGSGTEWGDGENVVRAGQLVFVDEAGDEWLECQLVKDPTAPLPEAVVSPWEDRKMVQKLLAEGVKGAQDIIMEGHNVRLTKFATTQIEALTAQLAVILVDERARVIKKD